MHVCVGFVCLHTKKEKIYLLVVEAYRKEGVLSSSTSLVQNCLFGLIARVEMIMKLLTWSFCRHVWLSSTYLFHRTIVHNFNNNFIRSCTYNFKTHTY